MRKRIFTIVVVFAVTMAICAPASAATAQEDLYQDATKQAVPVQEEAFSEYDYIVKVRTASEEEKSLMGVSSEEIEYIESNAI